MKSYIYMGITYHKKTWFYYMDNVKKKFKNHELICDWIEDNIIKEELSNTYETPLWKEYARQIYKRDNYTCRFCKYDCKNGDRKIHAHHRYYEMKNGKMVKPYDYYIEGINPVVISLCEHCHYHLHKTHDFTMPIYDRETGKLLNEDEPSRRTRLELDKTKRKEKSNA